MTPEITNNSLQPTDPKRSKLHELFKPDKPSTERSERVSSFFFYLSILFFIIGFNFSDVMVGNWYQQFMPNIGGRQIVDITFLDSLTGYAVTSLPTLTDTAFILKTTNGGNDWVINHKDSAFIFKRFQFINQNTGFAGGTHITRTTNAGANWSVISQSLFFDDMYVLNFDTIWFAKSESLTGGVFRTTNGGASWQNQLSLGSQNPSKIYMYNGRIGFTSTGAGLYRTTNSGMNWGFISGDGAFSDMFFIDSLTGWKASGFMKKTTDGGLNWINQALPIGNFLGNGANDFMNIKTDTIWATGETIVTGGSPPTRGILYRSTDSGNNWLYQLPDTSIHINRYRFGQFANRKIGWAYNFNPTGIHTTNGGDTAFYVPVNQISTEVPKEYRLFNNYPNPFNPITIIRFQINISSDLKIVVYDIQGKQITELVNQKQNAGTYEVDFDGSNYSSGVYFYSLVVEGAIIDTKRMILIK